MDETFAAGQLVKIVDNLQSPHGPCLSRTPSTVFVADGHTIKQLVLETKVVKVDVQGFKQVSHLSEPTGLSFDGDTAILHLRCFGGHQNGCIKLHTSVEFACRFMSTIRQIYQAIGFLPKKEQNHLAQLGKHPVAAFVDGTKKRIDSLAYLENLLARRKEFLKRATAGPEGTV